LAGDYGQAPGAVEVLHDDDSNNNNNNNNSNAPCKSTASEGSHNSDIAPGLTWAARALTAQTPT
jgi:hypothetical protein